MICRQPRDLPQLGALWERPEYAELRAEHGDAMVKAALREALAALRAQLLQGEDVDTGTLLEGVSRDLSASYGRVINATGTVLHTNLGRAPLGDILRAVAARLDGYSALEYDLEAGCRGRRGSAVERRLRWLTGSPAALVVNNCAAAMILLLSSHAKDREVVVSRGELVEIGGGFRIPDILAMSGARLVEVGTTNRTRIADFRRAITADTALLLTTHSSNFHMVGFTEAPGVDELLALGVEHDIPVAFDLGSGMLTPVVEGEPGVAEGARFPLCAFSGDKLLGGPQCGILMGQESLVEACRRHPLYRAFRCDKLTLGLLEESLRRHSQAPTSVPTLAFLSTPLESLKARAEALAGELGGEAVATRGQVGGGSLPGATLDSWGVAVRPPPGMSTAELHAALRRGRPPVVARLEKERLILDLKAVFPEEDALLSARLLETLT